MICTSSVLLRRSRKRAAAGCGVRDVKAGLRKSARRPNVEKSSATAIGDPETGILTAPATENVRVGGVIIVVDQLPHFFIFLRCRAWINSTVATEEANIINHGILARHPLESNGARVDAIRVKANARDDVIPAFGGFQQGLGAADTLEGRCSIGE